MDRNLDRRLFLASLASTGAIAACSGASQITPSGAVGSALGRMALATGPKLKVPTIPMEIVNQTGQRKLYYYLTGTTDRVKPQNQTYHLANNDGDLDLCKPTDGKQVTYCLPLTAEKTTIQLPRLQGIRIYFSIDEQLYVTVGDNGIPDAPAGWIVGNKNYTTLFDWIELDYAVDPNGNHEEVLGGNSTQVDQFGLPFTLSMTGKLPDGTVGTVSDGLGVADARNKILTAISQTPKFEQLVVKGGSTGFLRAISPAIASSLRPTPLFPADYYTSYIDKVWAKYTETELLLSAENKDFTGKVNGQDILEFRDPDDKVAFSFAKPTTEAVLRASPPLESKGGVQGIAVSAISANFNRSTLLVNNNLNACDEKQYYKDPITNHYSGIMHEYGAGGTAYGFGFDDWCSKSSFITVRVPESASVTILPF